MRQRYAPVFFFHQFIMRLYTFGYRGCKRESRDIFSRNLFRIHSSTVFAKFNQTDEFVFTISRQTRRFQRYSESSICPQTRSYRFCKILVSRLFDCMKVADYNIVLTRSSSEFPVIHRDTRTQRGIDCAKSVAQLPGFCHPSK